MILLGLRNRKSFLRPLSLSESVKSILLACIGIILGVCRIRQPFFTV